LDVALDLEKDATDKFTGSYFHQEIKGILMSIILKFCCKFNCQN